MLVNPMTLHAYIENLEKNTNGHVLFVVLWIEFKFSKSCSNFMLEQTA